MRDSAVTLLQRRILPQCKQTGWHRYSYQKQAAAGTWSSQQHLIYLWTFVEVSISNTTHHPVGSRHTYCHLCNSSRLCCLCCLRRSGSKGCPLCRSLRQARQ